MGKFKGTRDSHVATGSYVLYIPDCQQSVFVVLVLLPWNGWLVVHCRIQQVYQHEHVLPSEAHLWLLLSLAQWVRWVSSSLLNE